MDGDHGNIASLIKCICLIGKSKQNNEMLASQLAQVRFDLGKEFL